jgi:hypothetical protein
MLPNGSFMFRPDPTIGDLMPKKIYMSGQYRAGGGTVFNVSWDRIEDFLRGKPDLFADSNATLQPDEQCEFVITKDGINVYAVKDDADGN